jgi:signal transduction histidine kinase
MDQLQQFVRNGKFYTYILLAAANLGFVGIWWIVSELVGASVAIIVLTLMTYALLIPLLIVHLVSTIFIQPLRFVWQAILYIAPETSSVGPPEMHNVKYARELVTNLVNHIYQLADVGKHIARTTTAEADSLQHNFVANNLPLPLVVLDKDETIIFANTAMLEYLGTTQEDAFGKSIYARLDLAFESNNTLDAWLKQAKETDITSSRVWERVRMTLPGEGQPTTKLLDLAAYYNKENPAGYETMLILFDHTSMYSQDDQAISFVALAVHELRTPLTILRGYIEALEEELNFCE